MKTRKRRGKQTKSMRYKVLHPSGEWEAFRLPLCFSPRDLAERLVHSLIFVRVSKGRTVILAQGQWEGPGWALYSRDKSAYVLADRRDPETLSDAELAAAC